jgi:pimeloyl-ACP methyl ester carboxylesterase
MYYELHGTGQPLVLLPGGFATIDLSFRQLLPALAQTRQAIAVELQGHGHTADIDRPLRYELLADDIAALITHLGVGPADLFGFSLGGGVALQTAIRHPAVVRKLVVASAPGKSAGWSPEERAGMAMINAEAMSGSIFHEAYLRGAPQPEQWPRVVAKMHQLLSEQDYDWSEAITSIQAPTLIVVGDADGVRADHAVELLGLLRGGKGRGGNEMGSAACAQLAVLPGTTHPMVMDRVEWLSSMLTVFLDLPMSMPVP